MSDLIDRQALMKELGINDMDCKKCKWGHKKDLGYDCGRGSDFKDACFAIEHAPTIEPERKKGEWKRAHGAYYDRANCSNCDSYYPIDPDFSFNNPMMAWNFCPNCGADMRGEHDG